VHAPEFQSGRCSTPKRKHRRPHRACRHRAAGCSGERWRHDETKAEDRAEAVADIEQKKELPTRQRAGLSEFELRKDLPESDVLALMRESTQVDLQLDELAKARANEQHWIETNWLTIGFHADVDESRWWQIGASFGKGADQFADGTADTIEVVAYAVSMLFIALLFAVFLRSLWRRLRGKRAAR
jgi:hypothetical protein